MPGIIPRRTRVRLSCHCSGPTSIATFFSVLRRLRDRTARVRVNVGVRIVNGHPPVISIPKTGTLQDIFRSINGRVSAFISFGGSKNMSSTGFAADINIPAIYDVNLVNNTFRASRRCIRLSSVIRHLSLLATIVTRVDQQGVFYRDASHLSVV